MSDTELRLIGEDDAYFYFEVVDDHVLQGVACMQKVDPLREKHLRGEAHE